MQALVDALLVGIIVRLVAWINQAYMRDQWRWHSTIRPFAAAKIWPHVLTPAAEGALKPGDILRDCTSDAGRDYCPEMVVVPGGSFTMGSAATEQTDTASERPQHQVTIAKPFAVSKFLVTFGEWDTCAAYGDCDLNITDNG